MSVEMMLGIYLLALIPTGGLSCGGGGGGSNTISLPIPSCCPESKSPAGGPSANPNAVVCYFLRNSLRLTCIKGNTRETCNAVRTSETSDNLPGGPTPYGEYLIGKHHLSQTYRGLDWFNIYPKKEDNSGYYGYNTPNKNGRSAMGLHPGRISEGCVTIHTSRCSRGDYSCYNNDPCWKKIKSAVSSGDMSYRGSSYSGILYVI